MLTLGIGTGTPRASSPRSSIMFLMSIERSATSFSANMLAGFSVQSSSHNGVRREAEVDIPTLISSWSFDMRVMVSCSDMIAVGLSAVCEYIVE